MERARENNMEVVILIAFGKKVHRGSKNRLSQHQSDKYSITAKINMPPCFKQKKIYLKFKKK